MHLGIPAGLFICLTIAIQTQISCILYLKSKGKCESLYEIGFQLFGRKAIYFISILIGIYGWGANVIYFIVFSDIVKSLYSDHTYFLTSRMFLCSALGICILPLILKKEMKELKIASVILFLGISSFIILLGGRLLFTQDSINSDQKWETYLYVSKDRSVIKAFSIVVAAFAVQAALFPVINSLDSKSDTNVLKCVGLSN